MLDRAQSTLKNVNWGAMPRILSFLDLKTCGRSWANFYFLVVNFFNKKEKKIRHFWKFWKKNPRHPTVFTINRTDFEECLLISLGLRSTKSWGACYNRKKMAEGEATQFEPANRNLKTWLLGETVLFCQYDFYGRKSVACVFFIYEHYNKRFSFCLTELKAH